MPRPKNPEGYAVQYGKLIETVADGGQACTLKPFPNKKAAEAMRFTFYSFIKACRNSSKEFYNSIAKKSESLSFQIKDNILTIVPKDTAEESQILETAIDEYLKELESMEVVPVAPAPPEEMEKPEKKKQVNPFIDANESGELIRPTHEDAMAKLMGKGKDKK